MKTFPNLHKWVAWIYPPLCLHCSHKLHDPALLFCPLCQEWLSLVETKGKCRCCFKELGKSGCERCRTRKTVIHKQLAAVESMGPAASLASALKRGHKKCIDAAASLMAYQWLNGEKHLPAYLVPLPQTRLKKFLSEHDVAHLLANSLSKILNVPVLEALHAHYDHRGFMQGESMRTLFTIKRKKASLILDQHILLIAPTLDDQQLRAAGSALQLAYPAKIDALSFTDVANA